MKELRRGIERIDIRVLRGYSRSVWRKQRKRNKKHGWHHVPNTIAKADQCENDCKGEGQAKVDAEYTSSIAVC